ncbi:hypothetical protein RB213_011187 [Colletotrichum asianum]
MSPSPRIFRARGRDNGENLRNFGRRCADGRRRTGSLKRQPKAKKQLQTTDRIARPTVWLSWLVDCLRAIPYHT